MPNVCCIFASSAESQEKPTKVSSGSLQGREGGKNEWVVGKKGSERRRA